MTKEEFAARLVGVHCGSLSDAQRSLAREQGLVVVYGASDDLMEFDGAIYGEVGCHNGGTAYLTPEGNLLQPDDAEYCEHCPLYLAEKSRCKAIVARWCAPDSEYTWSYETEIPHATFPLIEGGKKYCRGIVFAISDLKNKL